MTYAPSSPGGKAYKSLAQELMAQDEATTPMLNHAHAPDAPLRPNEPAGEAVRDATNTA